LRAGRPLARPARSCFCLAVTYHGRKAPPYRPAQRGRRLTMRRDLWNTYAMTGYTHDVAQDQASAGGCHYYQVRRGTSGWQRRIRQANGDHEAYGPVAPISEADGEAAFATAQTY